MSRHFSTLNVSETTRDRAIVTTERQQEVICALSHGDISNYLEWPPIRVSRSRDTYKSNISNRCILGGQSY